MTEPKDNNSQELPEVSAPADDAASSETPNEVPSEFAQLQAELQAVKAEAADYYEQLLRAQAELVNQRRRAEKQIEDTHKYAVQRFVEALIPVIDSVEMGLQAQGDIEQIREGMQLTLKQFEAVMEKFNITAVGELGESFNPEYHQAMSMQPHPDFDNNTVSLVMQKGYVMNGRVVRPAMVTVCKK